MAMTVEDKETCDECSLPATFCRRTQFAGTHFYCTEHARQQKDFGRNDNSHFHWEERVLPCCKCGGESMSKRVRADGTQFFCEIHAAEESDFLTPDTDPNVRWLKRCAPGSKGPSLS